MPKQQSTSSAYEVVNSNASYIAVENPTNIDDPFSEPSTTVDDPVHCPPSQSSATLGFYQIPTTDRPESSQDFSEIWSSYQTSNRAFVSEPDSPLESASIATTPSEPGSPSSSAAQPEVYCDLEGCNTAFSGVHRKGNLARHKRLKHSGRVYVCENPSCERVFNRQDARLKHYRKYHQQLARPYVARPQTRHANKEQYLDFMSSASG